MAEPFQDNPAQPCTAEALAALTLAQASAGGSGKAEENYRTALSLEPGSVTALYGLGTLLTQNNRPAEGEVFLQSAAAQPALPPSLAAQIIHVLGIALDMQARHEEAAAAFRRAIALDPLHAAAHQELNALLYRLGRDGEFLASYETTSVRESGALLMQKAGFLMRAERFEEARECFIRAAAMAPNHPGPQNGLALAYAGLGRLAEAIAAHEKSLALRPDEPRTMLNLACTLLEAGDATRALGLTDAVMPRMPFDQSALAVHELALRANDDARAQQIADYERQIQIFDLKPPPGFSSMTEFNAALNNHLDGLHTDLREHVDQTLRHGTQTATSLLAGDNALVRALCLRIEEAVTVYIARMVEADKALAGRRRSGFSFAGSWSSRLRDCGFHTNHVHPGGWISSCYYVAVPDAVADSLAKPGWIKFGEPSFKTALRDPVRRAVQPVPGRLVLFPSYMWHGTIPFRGPTTRTTIAFDAIPV